MEFEKGKYASLAVALQAMHAHQAQNKIAMQIFATSFRK
jgi:hypothetical protein